MDQKIIPSFFAVAFMFFILYAAVFMTPLEKIDAACTPVTRWPGNLISAAVRIGDMNSAKGVDRAFDKYFNNCRRWVWNFTYREKYEAIKQQGNAGGADK